MTAVGKVLQWLTTAPWYVKLPVGLVVGAAVLAALSKIL